ncbi:MAG: 4-hydroxybenzoate octaprenyltransferase [bacterium]
MKILVDRLPEGSIYKEFALLMRLDKPIGTLLLLWPTLWGMWFAADGVPPVGVMVVFVLGVFFMRSAGCVINDYLDRDIDPHVERTRERPLAAGRIKPKQALLLFLVLIGLAFLLVLTQNDLTIELSLVAAVLAASYPLMKRYTWFPQVYLGAAFGWAIPMSYAAITNTVPPEAWLLFVSNILWVTAYDTQYAIVDREDDLSIGVKSTAIIFAELDLAIIAMLQFCFIFGLFLLGNKVEAGWAWQTGLGLAAVLFALQALKCRYRIGADCFEAFLSNNYVGMVIFIGLLLDKML